MFDIKLTGFQIVVNIQNKLNYERNYSVKKHKRAGTTISMKFTSKKNPLIQS